MKPEKNAQLQEAIRNFQFEGALVKAEPYGNGHINDTYLLVYEIGEMGIVKIILQKMNRSVFTKPVEVMENILGVPLTFEKRSLNGAAIRNARR